LPHLLELLFPVDDGGVVFLLDGFELLLRDLFRQTGFAVVLDGFAALEDDVGVSGFIAQVAAEFTVLRFGPFGRVGVGGVEATSA